MIWLRVGLLAAIVLVVALALTQTAAAPPPSPPTATPAPPTPAPPTRVPFPTLGPQMIISRTARETPTLPPSPTQSAAPRVAVIDNGYAPAQLTVASGTTIVWSNGGGDGHDVTGRGPDGVWRSGPLAPGDRYQRVFWIVGSYDYMCSVHPEMRGRVVVQP